MSLQTENVRALLPKPIDVNLYSDYSHQQASVIWLQNSIFKKFHDDRFSQGAKAAAVKKFLTSNMICRDYTIDRNSYYYELVLKAKQKLEFILNSGPLQEPRITLAKMLDRALPGPGSSLGTKETAFYAKLFESKLSTYDETLLTYKFYVDNLTYRWRSAEIVRNSKYGVSVYSASGMAFAHKSIDEARAINTEANLEMLFQKGAAAIIEELLIEFYNIDIRKQPRINRSLARLGSIYGTFSTIDLEDSSNRISTQIIEELLPKSTFMALDRIRTKNIRIPKELVDVDDTVSCSMFSTQGNGFTFALQTLIFASLTEACYEDLGLPADNFSYPSFSVFGDDIVCVTHAFSKVTSLLSFCGFTVNSSKSFHSGCFRESCGSDFFKGRNIRSVYIKRFRFERHKYSAFNRLLAWSIGNGIDLTSVLCYLKGLVVFRPVPFDEQDECGIKCPSQYAKDKLRGGRIQYTGFHPIQKRIDCERRFEVNEQGLFVSILGGYVESFLPKGITTKSHKIVDGYAYSKTSARVGYTVRQQRTSYQLRDKVTSSWDFIPSGLTIRDYEIAFLTIL